MEGIVDTGSTCGPISVQHTRERSCRQAGESAASVFHVWRAVLRKSGRVNSSARRNVLGKSGVSGRTNAFEWRNGPFASMDEVALSQENEHDLSSVQVQRELQSLIKNYKSVPPTESLVKIKILLSDDTPVCRPPRRLAPAEREAVAEQIREWLGDGII